MANAEPVACAKTAVTAALMSVDVAWSVNPQQTAQITVRLPPASTALDALRASGVADLLGAAVLDTLTLVLWGRAISPDTALQPQDRLELLRPLLVDPKEARRLRYRRDGIRPRRKPPRR